MSENYEVLFSLRGDIINDVVYRQIESIRNIAGLKAVSHIQGINTIDASAQWNRSEIDKKINEIRGIAGVQDVIIVRKTRQVKRNIFERVDIQIVFHGIFLKQIRPEQSPILLIHLSLRKL